METVEAVEETEVPEILHPPDPDRLTEADVDREEAAETEAAVTTHLEGREGTKEEEAAAEAEEEEEEAEALPADTGVKTLNKREENKKIKRK